MSQLSFTHCLDRVPTLIPGPSPAGQEKGDWRERTHESKYASSFARSDTDATENAYLNDNDDTDDDRAGQLCTRAGLCRVAGDAGAGAESRRGAVASTRCRSLRK